MLADYIQFLRTPYAFDLGSMGTIKGLSSHNLPAGQVLLYEGHLPPGIFVVTHGKIAFHSDKDPKPVTVNATIMPFLLPCLHALQQPAAATATIIEPVNVTYLPRSAILLRPELEKFIVSQVCGDCSSCCTIHDIHKNSGANDESK